MVNVLWSLLVFLWLLQDLQRPVVIIIIIIPTIRLILCYIGFSSMYVFKINV